MRTALMDRRFWLSGLLAVVAGVLVGGAVVSAQTTVIIDEPIADDGNGTPGPEDLDPANNPVLIRATTVVDPAGDGNYSLQLTDAVGSSSGFVWFDVPFDLNADRVQLGFDK